MTIQERLQKVFREVFDNEHLNINENTNQAELKDWDSLTQIRLILTCENEFKIKFSTAEVMDLVSVANFVKYIETKLG
jgi:acyl carrier protein